MALHKIKKVLIANRGEIAVRIIRACHELGIATVAIHSTADRDSLFVQMAEESVCVGGARSNQSYLNVNNIISAALETGADAIHPGFGFLSENAEFARTCEESGIIFIGPDADIIAKMGDKSQAREEVIKAGAPVVPGTEGALKSEEEAISMAHTIGYPVIIKASAGGGGKGMRIAHDQSQLSKAYTTAKMEAKAAFGDDTMYMEKFIVEPKHIEFQILADHHGNVIHLGERDCSMQRNNQKVIEEAPSVFINKKLREKMGEQAVKIAKAVGYKNAGTIEFLLDKDLEFYFMEMNTRIQVEHPVTEMVTGIDLIKEQIKIADGQRLEVKQKDVEIRGHAIEVRINAEDPSNNFMPSPGRINLLNLPGGFGVRNDTCAFNGYSIPPLYDSMISKLIVHAPTRDEAIEKLYVALEEIIVDGVKTNIDFLYELSNTDAFREGNYNTGFVGTWLEEYRKNYVKENGGGK